MFVNLPLLKATLDDIKGKLSSVKKELGLTNAVNHAITAIHDFETHQRARLPVSPEPWPEEALQAMPYRIVLLPLVLGLHSNKPTLSMICLSGLHYCLEARFLPPNMVFDHMFTSVKAPEIRGKGVAWVLMEALIAALHVAEHEIQLKALDCIACLTGDLRFDVSGQLLEPILRSAFNVHLTSLDVRVKQRAEAVLQKIVRDRIMTLAAANCARGSTQQSLFPPHHIFRVPPLPMDELELANEKAENDPQLFREVPVPFITTYLCHPDFEPKLHDVFLLLHTLLALAVKAIPPTVSDPSAIEVRSRVFALDLVNHAFASIDSDHVEKQHRALLPEIVGRLRKEVWRCIAQNMCYSLPFALFDGSVMLFTHVAMKAHHMHQDDIRWFHDLVISPLLKSRFSSVEMKLRILHMYRTIFNVPGLLIAYWLNYEAVSHSFDTGTLSTMVRTVVETMAIDYTDTKDAASSRSRSAGAAATVPPATSSNNAERVEGRVGASNPTSWAADAAVFLTQDQAILVQYECAAALNDCLSSLLRWLTEEETPYDDATVDDLSDAVGTLPRYTWWYLHQLYTNHCIVSEARSKFAVNWRDALAFLRDRNVIDGTAKMFAQFVHRTPRMDRVQLCGIFERVLKDPFCLDFVRWYFACFDYAHIPLDIALRDTTLEFMSFDRPVFEAQVWESIMHLFGAQYAAHNSSAISVSDADALASVILFLHTNLHNPKNKDKLGADDFIRYGSECMSVPLPPDEMRAMYNRVAGSMWTKRRDPLAELQAYVHVSRPHLPTLEPRREVMLQSTELGGNMALYAENLSHLSRNQQSALIIMQYVADGIERFNEASQASLASRRVKGAVEVADSSQANQKLDATRVTLPAYCVPFYAQHVRPILTSLYAYFFTAAYISTRLAQNQRHVRLTQQLYVRLSDLCAAFALSQSPLQDKAIAVLHECLRQDSAIDLGQPDVNIALYCLHSGGV